MTEPRPGDHTLTNEELATRAQEAKRVGRTGPFEELVARLERTLFGFLSVRVGNAADAEELVQETFLRAWNKLHYYDARYRFSTWLFTLAKRLAVSRARTRRPDVLPDEVLGGVSPEPDPADRSAQVEESSRVWDVAAKVLTPEQRSALWLRYAEDLSNEEIAAILGKRRVTVRVLLFRAREALGRALGEPDRRAATDSARLAALETAKGMHR